MSEPLRNKATDGLIILSAIFAIGVGIATRNIGWGIAAFPAFLTVAGILIYNL